MTFEVLYNEAHGSVKTTEIDATCLFEAEAKFKEAHPEAVYWEIGIEIDADLILPARRIRARITEGKFYAAKVNASTPKARRMGSTNAIAYCW